MQNSKISLIIPAYNEEKYIGNCLDYVLRNTKGKLFEIIVVDNKSTDNTAKIAISYPGVRVVSEENKGLVRARQRGFMESRGDILAYIDADTQMPDFWFYKILEGFSEGSVVCVSGPYVYYDISKFQQFLVKIYWYILAMPVYYIVGYMVVGGNFAIRRKTVEKMGGFDTTIEFYGEDTNIARRASKEGKVKFNPSMFMYTSGRRLSGQGIWKTAYIYISNFLSEAFLHKPLTKEYTDIR